MTSLHTFLHTQYVYVLGRSVSQSISMASVRNEQSVCGCVMLRAYSHNHPGQ